MAKVYGQSRVADTVAHQPGIRDAIQDTARDIHGRAEARLAGHREHGMAKVVVTHGKVDSFVTLVDRAAVSIEYGHMYTGNLGGKPKFVGGLYIVTGAAYNF